MKWPLFYSLSHTEISSRKTDLQFVTFLTPVVSTMKLVTEYLDYRTSKRAIPKSPKISLVSDVDQASDVKHQSASVRSFISANSS